MTVLYKVKLSVSNEVIQQYLEWLDDHVEEMLKFSGFQSAEKLKTGEDDSFTHITVTYTVASRKDLDAYFEKHAEKMREDGVRRFGGKFSATRDIIELE